MSDEVDGREQAVKDLFDLLNSRRYDEVGSIFTDDALFSVVYVGEEYGSYQGSSAIQDLFVSTVSSLFDSLLFEIDETYLVVDTESIIIEYRSQGTLSSSGKPYRNRYVGIFRIRDKHIASWREYHNPQEVERSNEAV